MINDTWGHDIGDAVLISVAAMLRRHLRVTDTCARLGGDEFAILLPATDARAAARIIQRLHAHLAGIQVADVRGISCSVGVTTFVAKQASMNQMLRSADQAMYQSKHQGKGQMYHIVMNTNGMRPMPVSL